MHSSLCSMSSFILFIGQNLNLKQTYQFLGGLVIILVTEILIRVGGRRGKTEKESKEKSLTAQSFYRQDNGNTAINL